MESEMSCGTKTIRGRKPVWSDGTDGIQNVGVIFFEGLTSEVSAFNVAFLIEGKSTNFRASPYVAYSNDGITWDAPNPYGSYVSTANAWQYPSTWETVTDTKRLFRIGIVSRNVSGQTSNVEMGTVSVIISQKPR